MKKLLFVAITLLGTPVLILICLVTLFYIQDQKEQIKMAQSKRVAYAALPSIQNLLSDRIYSKDARFENLEKFLKKYKSELSPFVDFIISEADRNNIDYKLVPAIAMQESNLCKKAPKQTYNCWGWGIYGTNRVSFKNYSEGIQIVSKNLAKYKEKGLEDLPQIASKYNPRNTNNWVGGVSHFMREIDSFTP